MVMHEFVFIIQLNYVVSFLGAFAKLRKVTISVVKFVYPPVRPSVRM